MKLSVRCHCIIYNGVRNIKRAVHCSDWNDALHLPRPKGADVQQTGHAADARSRIIYLENFQKGMSARQGDAATLVIIDAACANSKLSTSNNTQWS